MISPLKLSSNINFKGSSEKASAFGNFKSYENYQKQAYDKVDKEKITKIEQDVDKNTKDIKEVKKELKKNKPSLYTRTKGRILGIYKAANNAAYISAGAFKGILQGVAGFYGVSFLGKNIKSAITEKNPLVFLQGAFSDICKVAGKIGKNIEKIPSTYAEIFAKQPDVTQGKAVLNTIRKISTATGKGIQSIGSSTTRYLKGNKLVAGIAVAAGLALVAKNVIQAKINANLKNSNLDHKFNYGHNK